MISQGEGCKEDIFFGGGVGAHTSTSPRGGGNGGVQCPRGFSCLVKQWTSSVEGNSRVTGCPRKFDVHNKY